MEALRRNRLTQAKDEEKVEAETQPGLFGANYTSLGDRNEVFSLP